MKKCLFEFLRSAKKALATLFVYPNFEKFDADFCQLLQIYFLFGFYQPTPSKLRLAYGIISLLLVHVSFFAGIFLEATSLFSEGEYMKTVFLVPVLVFAIPNMSNVCFSMMRSHKVTDLIKDLHSLHEYEDNDAIEACWVKWSKIVKLYKIYLAAVYVIVSILTVLGFKVFIFLFPALYDVYAHGSFFYPLLMVNFVHVGILVATIVTSDLLHVLCMVRVGKNFQILGQKLQHSTDSDDLIENEKNLIACVKYHVNIIE